MSMANSDDDSAATSSSSSSSTSSSSSSSSSIRTSSKSPAAAKETSASYSPADDQLSSLAGGAIKAEDGHSDANKSEDEGAITQPTCTKSTAGVRSKRGGRIRGGQKKRPRSRKGDEDQNEDEDSDSDGAIVCIDEVQPTDASAKKSSERLRQDEDQQSVADAVLDVDASCCSNSPTAQYWSDQAMGPSGDGTIFEGMNQMAVADIVGWSHAIGGGNGSRVQLSGGRSDIPIPPWGLSLHQPPPFQPIHSEAAPMRSEVPPPPQLLGLLLRCAEEKMNKSGERVMNNTEQERKMKILRQMNNMFDPSALIAAGVAVEEILTSALLPLAAAHVSRCRAMDHQSRIISNRGRKQINEEDGHDSKNNKKNKAPTKSSKKEGNRKTKKNPKKGSEETDDKKEESVDDAVALDRDAFDAWTLPPTEALIQLAKKRKLGQQNHRESASRPNTSFLPSAAPTPKAIQRAMESAGRDQEQVQANTVAAYRSSAAAWCQHHGLDSGMVQERTGDLLGLFLPKEPPRECSNSTNT